MSGRSDEIDRRDRRRRAYHFDGSVLDQNGLREGRVVRLNHVDPLPLQDLHNAVMVQTVIVGVRVDVGQGQAVELGTGQRLHDLRLEAVVIVVVLVEGLDQVGRDLIICLGQEP